MASGQLVSDVAEVSVPFNLGNQCFNEKFLLLKSANFLILGCHSSKSTTSKNLLHFPDIKIQVDLITKRSAKTRKRKNPDKKPRFYFQKSTFSNQQNQRYLNVKIRKTKIWKMLQDL